MAQIISNEQNTLSDLETRLVAAKEEEEGRGKNGGGAAWSFSSQSVTTKDGGPDLSTELLTH